MNRAPPCPRCGRPARLDPLNPERPFCSRRCRLIDLGAWASEQMRIAGPELAPEEGDDTTAVRH
ncbi:MAG: DNA gyrase inhibitor YacG [Gammaproteobacteria bacterium]|nr:DNA gyrase inhibitor YacG [Gammaproteobacteria bacterium]